MKKTDSFNFFSNDQGGSECRVISSSGQCLDREFTVFTEHDNAHFCDLTLEEQTLIIRWLRWNVLFSSKVLHGHTSYGMKHDVTQRTNIYITNNQMKEAMLKIGHFPYEVNTLNWEFCVSKSSPIFKRQIDGHYGLPLLGAPLDYPGFPAIEKMETGPLDRHPRRW